MTSDFKRAVGILGGITLVILLVAFWPRFFELLPAAQQPATQDPATTPPSPYVQAQLAKSTGAEYLVSYTDKGFEPANLTIDQYLTVRFTNNSSNTLWVAQTGLHDTPVLDQNTCNQNAFDSCYAVPPHEFWEHTFLESGTMQYENVLDASKTGAITVTEEM